MAHRRFLYIAIAGALFLGGFVSLWGETVDVRRVEFKGLKYLTPRELMEQVRFVKNNEMMRIDMASLKEVLSKTAMVRASSIAVFEEKLVVTVTEREPEHVCAVVKASETIPFELDDLLGVVSVRNIYRNDVPVVVFREEDLPGGRLSERAIKLFKGLSLLKKHHAELYRELSEVKFLPDGMYEIRLKGRNTKIIVQDSAFSTLKYIVSVLDEKKYYPNALWIGAGFGVIK